MRERFPAGFGIPAGKQCFECYRYSCAASVTTVGWCIGAHRVSAKSTRGDGTRRIALSGIARPERFAHTPQTITSAVEPERAGFSDGVHVGGDECVGKRV